MRRGTIILIVFIVAVVLVVGASLFLRSQPPLEVTIAVNPLVEDWARNAAAAYNATSPVVNATRRVQVNIVPIDDLDVWGSEAGGWNNSDHPDGWIPGASFSVDFANTARLPFDTVVPSTARTALAWGAFASAAETITASGDVMDWTSIHDVAESDGLSLAFPHPARSLSGLAVALSAAGDFSNSADLGAAQFSNEYRNWLLETMGHVPNFNTLGASVAETLASRGQSIGAAALLAESEWLNNLSGRLVDSGNALTLAYPEYTFAFDFPLAVWNDPNAANLPNPDPDLANRAAAVQAFGNFLLTDGQQAALQGYGLRPPDGVLADVPAQGSLFSAAAEHGIIVPETLSGSPVQAGTRNDLIGLISSLNQNIR
jgi:hypothetical protein